MIPLSDDNPVRSVPYVTYLLILANVAVFLYELTLGDSVEGFVDACGFIPAELVTGQDIPPPACVHPVWLTIFTSMFMHAGLFHIAGNMLFLWIFGNNVEDSMGSLKFLVFYLLCGVAAALTQTVVTELATPDQATVPNLGASGAIAGVLGAYLVLYPHARVKTLIFLGFFVQLTYIPAMIVLGIWFVLQFFQGLFSLRGADTGGVAVWAHVGGFLAGILLVRLFARGERGRRTSPAYRF
jgi:membrane associated rhomboid family serine protease